MNQLTDVETTLEHRVVLLGIAELSGAERVPAHAGEVAGTCIDNLNLVGGDVLGTISEAEVARTLNELEDAGLVERADVGDTSAVGKGRPTYVLQMSVESLCETLADDDRLTELVDHVQTVRR
jgi:hypothetical protein